MNQPEQFDCYVVFAGDNYYPTGGWGDWRGSANTLDGAGQIVNELRDVDWWQIVDVRSGAILKNGRR